MEIPSTLDTAKYRRLVLEDLNNITALNASIAGFAIPAYNDVVMLYANAGFPTKPTTITFKQGATPVYVLLLTYDVNGAVTRVVQG
jgi:hypothetical protein